MASQHVTTYQTKQRVIWAAMELLKRAGMDVVKADTSEGCTLSVIVPRDTRDIHGERLRAIQET